MRSATVGVVAIAVSLSRDEREQLRRLIDERRREVLRRGHRTSNMRRTARSRAPGRTPEDQRLVRAAVERALAGYTAADIRGDRLARAAAGWLHETDDAKSRGLEAVAA
jgi:hypothetical protein